MKDSLRMLIKFGVRGLSEETAVRLVRAAVYQGWVTIRGELLASFRGYARSEVGSGQGWGYDKVMLQ